MTANDDDRCGFGRQRSATADELVWTLHEALATLGVSVMAMAGNDIERLIKEAFPDARVVVVDLAGDGDHFAARVTSAAFKGKSRVQQHTMVYNALQGQMGGALHALALQTIALE